MVQSSLRKMPKFSTIVILLFASTVASVIIYVSFASFSQSRFVLNSSLSGDDEEIGDESPLVDGGGLSLPSTMHPLSIAALRQAEYPGSELIIEQTLPSALNYSRYVASYKSEGLKIYGLLTIPTSAKPVDGYPVIIFNHGYIAPSEYRTTEKYIAYTDAFSRNGYILFRPDYRGHGNSEGEPAGGYGSNAYTIDVLNAMASVQRHPEANSDKVGMWGHSMGGHITLRSMIVNKDVKVGVIWAGVVASYPDLINNWRRNRPSPSPVPTNSTRSWRFSLVEQYGSPESNPAFWDTLSAHTYLAEISGPLQLHHGTADSSVPVEFSNNLATELESLGLSVENYTYVGDDHNLSQNFSVAMRRSVEFFDRYLK